MTDKSTPAPRTGWSAPARRTFRETLAANPGLDEVKVTGLYTACDLLSEADKMQKQINDDGLMVTGSMGQMVAHPLIAEVRQYRKAATDALRTLGLDSRSPASAAASALANKRWSKRGRAVI